MDGEGDSKLETLNLAAPFAQVTADGDFKQIRYEARIDLASLQSELGPFVNLGEYGIAGEVSSTGEVSIQEGSVGTSGSLSAKRLVLTAPDGNSVSEVATNMQFALGLNHKNQILAVDSLSATTGFGTFSVAKTAIPLEPNDATPLNMAISARDVHLEALKPYAVLFASFPSKIDMAGVAQSQLTVSKQKGVYHIATDATRIQDFSLTSPDNKPFQQKEVTAMLDVYVDPARPNDQRRSAPRWTARKSRFAKER